MLNDNKPISLWFTLDFELGWGVSENGLWHLRESLGVYDALHKRFDEVLALFTAAAVPVTWATVGAMLVERPKWEFDHLPEGARQYLSVFGAEAKPSTYFGLDLFGKVLAAGEMHSIGCHSYSHVRFNYPGMTESAVAQDLSLVRDTLASHGAQNTSLVLPQNIASNIGSLASTGITLCRTAPLDRQNNRYIRKLRNSIGVFPPAQSWSQHGLEFNSGTQFFNCPRGKPHAAYLLWLLKRHTITAMSKGHDMHYWAHPFNFTLNPALLNVAREYFDWLAQYRDSGRVRCVHWQVSGSRCTEAAT